MSVHDTFARRMKREAQNAPVTDAPQQQTITDFLRMQIFNICLRAIGKPFGKSNSYFAENYEILSNIAWGNIAQIARQELEDFYLIVKPQDDPITQCRHYLSSASTEGALSITQLMFQQIPDYFKLAGSIRDENQVTVTSQQAINELNQRFNLAGVGYQFEHGIIVAVNSHFIHAEAVSPAFIFLSQSGFDGALDEFEQAHKYYLAGQYKSCISNACNSFESTLKIIFSVHNWSYDKGFPASKLIGVSITEGLVPEYMREPFQALPTLRNKTSGHGQGQELVVVSDYEAAYGLHLAASNIVLLMKAHTAMSSKSAK